MENTHEPIVEKELFDRVRKVLVQKVEEGCFFQTEAEIYR